MGIEIKPPIFYQMLPIDRQTSMRWAISSIQSAGFILLGYTMYDLVNLHTMQAHRLIGVASGMSVGFPISGSFTAMDYKMFKTNRPVTFDDFNARGARDLSASAGLYSISNLKVWDGPAYSDLQARRPLRAPRRPIYDTAYGGSVLLDVTWWGWGYRFPGAASDTASPRSSTAMGKRLDL